MKTILLIVLGCAVGVYVLINIPTTVTSIKEVKEVIEIEKEVTVKKDVIEQSKLEMERISSELDTEETKILEEKSVLEEEYKLKQSELDSRLESITEIRLSF